MSFSLCLRCFLVLFFFSLIKYQSSSLSHVFNFFFCFHETDTRGEEQRSKSPSSLLFEPISPSSLNVYLTFSPSSLLFPPISPSSQLFLGHFSLLPILFLPPHTSTFYSTMASKLTKILNNIKEPQFCVSQKSLRDLLKILERDCKARKGEAERGSGISQEYREIDQIMEEYQDKYQGRR